MKTIQPLLIGEHQITPIVVSTIMGHSGDGMFPLNLSHAYLSVMEAIRETGTTVLTKSSTYRRRVGNFQMGNPFTWKYIQRFGENGLLNAYGLTNKGVRVNARAIATAVNMGYNVIPNFYPQFAKGQEQAIDETLWAMEIYKLQLGSAFWAMEFNFSCPNAKEAIQKHMADALACVTRVRSEFPELVLIAKISVVHPHEFAQNLVRAGVKIIHGVNSVPYDLIRPKGPPSPLASVGGGGVSGGPAFNRGYQYNRVLRQMIHAPIIMGCGVVDQHDVATYFETGAAAVSICSVVRLNPKEAVKIIKRSAA